MPARRPASRALIPGTRHDDSPAPPLARTIAARFASLPPTIAVALGGSRVAGATDNRSDLDLYVYSTAPIPLAARAAIAANASFPELDHRFWEPGDTWTDPASGLAVDITYRTPAWIEAALDRILVRHQASLGYSTSLWHNVLTSVPLADRDGWFAALRARANQPYPEPLRRAIVAKNHPLLRAASFSYRNQIAAALARGDTVAVQHRLTAFLASFFDILFALNRQPHPGEKRLVRQALTLCPLLPADFARRIDALFAAASPLAPSNDLVPRIDALIDGLDDLLRREGLIPSPPHDGVKPAPGR